MSQPYGRDPIPPTQALPAHARPVQPAAPGWPQHQPQHPQHPYAGPDVLSRRPAYPGTEPAAVASLVSGILGILVPLVGVLAIVLGGIGLDRTRRRGTSGRGMAATGLTLGSVQVVLTAALVVGAWAAWNAVETEVERTVAQANELAQVDLSFLDLVAGGLSEGVSFGDLGELAGSVGELDQLRGAADECQAGDLASCETLLGNVPEGLLPEDLSGRVPSSD